MSWPAVVLWLAIVGAALSRGPGLIYLLLMTSVFGSLQMLPGEGGATLLPQSACAAVLVGKTMFQRGNILRSIEVILDLRRLGLLTAFVAYAVCGAFILPRVFAGMIEVVPISGLQFGTDVLKPSAGNFTQSGYMLLSFATMTVFAVIGKSEIVQRHYLLALLASAICIVVTGIVDLTLYHLGLSSLLDPFRTATYALLTDVEALGAKRVVGLTPEASVYGSLCVGAAAALTFLRPLFRPGTEQSVAVITIMILIVMVALSTSSGSYLGFAVFCAVYGASLLRRMMRAQADRRERVGIEMSLLVCVAFAAFAAFVINPSIFDPIVEMVDQMVFQKSSSSSYIERTLWTQVGWNAFLDSGGLGVGLGSLRVSNWTISILGSTGIFGGVLMLGFLTQRLIAAPRNVSKNYSTMSAALKMSLLPGLAIYQVGGTIPDIGITASVMLGILAAGHCPPESDMPIDLRTSVDSVVRPEESMDVRTPFHLNTGDIRADVDAMELKGYLK